MCIEDLGVLVCRQDRFFARVSASFPEALRQSTLFKTAQEALHKPLRVSSDGESFKSRDARANLQVTFMREEETVRRSRTSTSTVVWHQARI